MWINGNHTICDLRDSLLVFSEISMRCATRPFNACQHTHRTLIQQWILRARTHRIHFQLSSWPTGNCSHCTITHTQTQISHTDTHPEPKFPLAFYEKFLLINTHCTTGDVFLWDHFDSRAEIWNQNKVQGQYLTFKIVRSTQSFKFSLLSESGN